MDLTLCLIEFSCWRRTGGDLISCSRALEGPDRCSGSESVCVQEPPLCQCHTGERYIHSFINSLAGRAQIQPHSCHKPRRMLKVVEWIQFAKQRERSLPQGLSLELPDYLKQTFILTADCMWRKTGCINIYSSQILKRMMLQCYHII